MIFKSLFGKKKNITNQPPLPKPKAPHSTPEEISQLFTSTLLTDNYQGCSELSNEIDQKLIQEVMSELRDFDTSTIPKIAEASIELMDKLLDPEISSSEVVAVIKEDPALLGKLMQTANSAFHRKSQTEINTLDDAVVLIGNDEIRKLVIGALMSGQLKISSVDSMDHCNSLINILICMSTFDETTKANFYTGRERTDLQTLETRYRLQ